MTKRRVLIETGALLTDGVDSILQDDENINIISKTFDSRENFLETVNELKPDTIILSASTSLNWLEEFLNSDDQPAELRVIVMSEKENQVQFFKRKPVTISSIDDLSELI